MPILEAENDAIPTLPVSIPLGDLLCSPTEKERSPLVGKMNSDNQGLSQMAAMKETRDLVNNESEDRPSTSGVVVSRTTIEMSPSNYTPRAYICVQCMLYNDITRLFVMFTNNSLLCLPTTLCNVY